jgi:methyltransferase (TIGR00027 family)
MKIINDSFAGLATAAARVIELYYPEHKRLFDDRFALDLLPFWWRAVVKLLYFPGLRSVVLSWRERRMPGALGAILCRTRYIDDVLKRSVEEGIQQLVILGAGFDSRAYRIGGMEKVQVFEVDFPGTQKLKQLRLEKVIGAVPGNVTLVGLDFEQQKLDGLEKTPGFQKGKKTLFICEGVSQYVTEPTVNTILEFVSGVSVAGSAIVFTYVRRGLIDGTACPEWFRRFLLFADKVGSPLLFGLEPGDLGQFLADRGLKLTEEVGAAEYQKRYLVPLGREMDVFDGERVAVAEVTKHFS